MRGLRLADQSDKERHLLAVFYNNSVEYLEHLDKVIGVGCGIKEAGEKEAKPVEECIDFGFIQSIWEEIRRKNEGSREQRMLRFIAGCLGTLFSMRGGAQAVLSLASFHIDNDQIEKGASFLQKLLFDDSIDDVQKECHNEIVKLARQLA